MSRRQGRYERRQEKRQKNLEARNREVGGAEDVFTYYNMYKWGKTCCNGVRWKKSTQRFERSLFSETAARRRRVLEGKWCPDKCSHFVLAERGKTREIDAPYIEDRQIEKVLTKEVLTKLYLPEMIYNNGASLPGKGFQFSKDQLKKELQSHFRKYGWNGWIILMDFQKFFPSASHEVLYERHKKLILDDDLREIADKIVRVNKGDRGLPLGVEPSQLEMIALPTALDNYIKCQLSMKGYGHYMDDGYILVPPDRDPHEILALVRAKAELLGLTLHPDKTKIQPIGKPFRYCKAKYEMLDTGKVLVHGNPKSMQRARRKIRAFGKKIEAGEMTYEDLWTSINGALAYFESYDDHGKVLDLRRYFYKHFGFSPENYHEFKMRDMEHAIHCAQEIQGGSDLRAGELAG